MNLNFTNLMFIIQIGYIFLLLSPANKLYPSGRQKVTFFKIGSKTSGGIKFKDNLASDCVLFLVILL
jgi:hypothetical protein